MTTDINAPDYLTYGDMEQLRFAVRRYIVSLGYQQIDGDGGGDSSADDEGLYGLETFRSPTAGKTLFVELKIGEERQEELTADWEKFGRSEIPHI